MTDTPELELSQWESKMKNSGPPAQRPIVKHESWECKILTLEVDNLSQHESRLNELGLEGWEPYGVATTSRDAYTVDACRYLKKEISYMLKRRIRDEPTQ